ncbi:tetratricopeptide repeat protein [Burkholderia ubonensis]|uniref:tetratricopeptide repeat protein n=1 Tax=Burkholderia ubonensis TaxID=101571 RepID=UPI0009B3CF0B|nr:tetratricopeptide repeat protein [Burkholderia ubonensis]
MHDAEIVELINQIGYFLRRKGQFDSALRVFKALQRMNPDCAYPHMGQALVRAEQGNMEEAKLHLRLVLSRHPDHSFALACLGLAMLQGLESNWRDPLSRAMNIEDGMSGKAVAGEILSMLGPGTPSRVSAAPVSSTTRRLKRFS